MSANANRSEPPGPVGPLHPYSVAEPRYTRLEQRSIRALAAAYGVYVVLASAPDGALS
jgi:hypothetical protein